MKKVYCFLTTILLLVSTISSLQAQSTSGKEFWVSFGNYANALFPNPGWCFQIRIVSSNAATAGTIYFTNSKESVTFSMNADTVHTYTLTAEQQEAVYNISQGVSDKSIHITCNNSVTVYAILLAGQHGEATGILPVTALDTEYYQISYKPVGNGIDDAYLVVATQNDTRLYHNGEFEITLDAGDVYYKTLNNTDMTGTRITATYPVAFFAVGTLVVIPFEGPQSRLSPLVEQLAPVKTWGKNFFVPVSNITRDIVRIVASQDGTNISQTGGIFRPFVPVPGSHPSLTGIPAGRFVELEVGASGCYIEANKPVGVCSFLTSWFLHSKPAQCWIPAIEQKISQAKIVPFKSNVHYYQPNHFAIVCTPAGTEGNTTVSVGGAPPTTLTGGNWIENAEAKMSFYVMPLEEETAVYTFTNPAGLIVLCYADGNTPPNYHTPASYYYLAGAAMRELDAAFYANNIHFQELKDTAFCENELVAFRADIEGTLHSEQGHLKWYINGEEKISARDELEWNNTFDAGEYEIRMWGRYQNNDTLSKTDTLKIKSCDLIEIDFYANNVLNFEDTIFRCRNITFRAELEGLYEELKWFIDDEVAAQNQEEWSNDFTTGEYAIKMWVRFEDNQTASITKTLRMDVFWVKIRNVRD